MTRSKTELQMLDQVELLNAGKPLAAFDAYFAEDGVMFANDQLFARGAAAARQKQEPFINAARSIAGEITDFQSLPAKEQCVFHNRTRFTDAQGNAHQIDGLCWQQWRGGKIIEERYYDGTLMQTRISEGILAPR